MKKTPLQKPVAFFSYLYKNYFLLLDVVDFLVEHDDFEVVVDDFLQELLEHPQEEDHCSTAIDQNFSSWPIGQPAFCHR